MSGNREGGLKAAQKNLEKNPNFYADIGRIGGRNGHDGGFKVLKTVECDCDLIKGTHKKTQCAGAKGGAISKRRPTPPITMEEVQRAKKWNPLKWKA